MFCSHLASKVRRLGYKLWHSRSRLKDLCLWRFLVSLLILGIWGKHFRLPDWRKRLYTLWSICQKTYSRHWQNYSMARCFDSCTNIATVCYARITSLSTFTTPSLNIYNTPCCCRWSSSENLKTLLCDRVVRFCNEGLINLSNVFLSSQLFPWQV